MKKVFNTKDKIFDVKRNPKLKIAIWFLVILALAFLVAHVVDSGIQKRTIQKTTVKEIDNIRSVFDQLQERDTIMLSSALEVITYDQNIRGLYLEKDREKLYNYVQPLFENLKNNYGITHWYFISPEGKTFLRVHNKDLYGDEITRFTFWRAENTEEISSGIELGKTAYALRVVVPYYNNDELIGYMELGEEIDHFLNVLKDKTNDEFILVAEKELLDKEKWVSVNRIASVRNNWDDSEKYIIIDSTTGQETVSDCFKEKNLEDVERGGRLFQQIEDDGKIFRCAGISFEDARGIHAGALLSSIDITEQVSQAKSTNRVIFIFSVLLFTVIILTSRLAFPLSFGIEKRRSKRKRR